MNGRPHIVFDLDGTLSDPILGIERSINYALGAFGYREVSRDEVIAAIGPPIDVAFGLFVPDADERRTVALVAKFRERYSEVGYSENVLYPKIPYVLQTLANRGVPAGVCTAKRIDFAEQILKMFEIRDYFEFVSGGDIGIAKSEQLRSLVAGEAIHGDSIMIGDRHVDIEAAHANGLSSAGALWGHGTRAELLAANARTLLSSPADILDLEHAR